ncbi:MAG: hypothetical protein M3N34_03915 [Pseudomonadota bacterium]|nr:hypothetical protein [Pseudomonadota bacterium]
MSSLRATDAPRPDAKWQKYELYIRADEWRKLVGSCRFCVGKSWQAAADPYLERDEIWLNRRGIPKGEFF